MKKMKWELASLGNDVYVNDLGKIEGEVTRHGDHGYTSKLGERVLGTYPNREGAMKAVEDAYTRRPA